MAERNKRIVTIPENVKVTLDRDKVVVEGPKGMVTRRLYHPMVSISKENNEVICITQSTRRKDIAVVGTFASHIRNMIVGVTEGIKYEMKLVYSHFPVKMRVKDDEFIVENFLGERYPRKAKILTGTKVEIQGEKVILTGVDIEKVGQTAANIERATRVKGYDTRVFQDGIYITSKGEVNR